MGSSEKKIIKTLLYSDIFDFPLLEKEIWNYLISEERVSEKYFIGKIRTINSVVFRKSSYLFTSGREDIVQTRLKRIKQSIAKLGIARKIIRKLFVVPTILFVGISGNLSMLNSEKKDDIDLFVIVRKNRIWTTRLLLIGVLKLMGKYRERGQKNVSNKFCLNMLIDETGLKVSSNLQNLYTAHEVSQLMPIRQREGIYSKFIASNPWIVKFLPNIEDEIKKRKIENHSNNLFEKILSVFLKAPFIEFLARKFQLYLINKNTTSETISDNLLAFHPRDYKSEILSEYNKRLLGYGIS